MITTLLIGAVVLAGLGWAWVHYRKQTTDALDKVGNAVDDAVNKAEDTWNKK